MTKPAKLFEKAIKLYQKGDLSGAKSQCLRAQKSTKAFPQVYFLLGCIARDEGNFGYAVSQYKKAIEIDPKPYHFHLNLSYAYEALGRLKDSLMAMKNASTNVDTTANAAMVNYNIGCLHSNLCRPAEAFVAFQKAIELNPKIVDAHNQLGVILLQENRNQEAVESFQQAIALDSQYLPACRNLGVTYMQMGEQKYALFALNRFLELNGPDVSVSHMVNALSGKQTETAPAEYIESLFGGMADHFEKHLVERLEYDIPAKMMTLLASVKPPIPTHSHRVLDLGCGTGLMGSLLASISQSIDGVDLSQAMLDKAQEKAVYRQLVKDDVVGFIRSTTSTEQYSLVTAADVFIYLGELDSLFSTIKNSQLFSSETILAFSLESSQSTLYKLQPSGRFAHSEGYMADLCERYGFRIVAKQNTVIRKESGQTIDGVIFILQLGV